MKKLLILIVSPVPIFLTIVAVLGLYVFSDDTTDTGKASLDNILISDKQKLSPVLTTQRKISNLVASDHSDISTDITTDVSDINFKDVKKLFGWGDAHNSINSDDISQKNWGLPKGIGLDDIPEKYKEKPDEFAELLNERLNNKLSDDVKQTIDPILFTLSTPESNGHIIKNDRFSPHCIRVYAVFSSESDNMKARETVLVKWYDSAGQTELFQYLPINKNASINYIWREKPYWEAGTYSVDVFELENDIRPLASGTYTIEDMEEYISYLALYGSNIELTSRNIFSSDEEIFLRFNYSARWSKGLPITLYYQGGQYSTFYDAVQLDSSIASTGEIQVKYIEDLWRIGAYEIAIQSEQGQLLNKTIFYIID